MGFFDYVILAVVAVLLFFAVRYNIKKSKSGSCCGCSCSCCDGCGKRPLSGKKEDE